LDFHSEYPVGLAAVWKRCNRQTVRYELIGAVLGYSSRHAHELSPAHTAELMPEH